MPIGQASTKPHYVRPNHCLNLHCPSARRSFPSAGRLNHVPVVAARWQEILYRCAAPRACDRCHNQTNSSVQRSDPELPVGQCAEQKGAHVTSLGVPLRQNLRITHHKLIQLGILCGVPSNRNDETAYDVMMFWSLVLISSMFLCGRSAASCAKLILR